jgi:hypothetical protein
MVLVAKKYYACGMPFTIKWLIRNLADAGELQAGQLWRPHGT